MLRLLPLALLLLASSSLAACGGSRRRGHGDGDDGRRRPAEPLRGRPDRRPGPARRQRLQRARLQGLKRARGGARDRGPRDRVRVGGGLHPEHDLARAPGLRPRDRRRLRAGRCDRQGRAAVPGRRSSRSSTSTRRSSRASRRTCRGCSSARRRSATSSATSPALEEKRRDGADVISAVGGMKEPPVDRFIAGYFAGAEKAAPAIKTVLDYSQDWDDQAKCKELALNQIARGSGVVFQVAGGCGLGALNAAGERKRLGDRRRRRPVVPRPAHPHEREEGRRLGRLPDDRVDPGRGWQGGGNATFGLKEEGVGLGKVSPEVPQEDVDAVDEIEQQIADGEITGSRRRSRGASRPRRPGRRLAIGETLSAPAAGVPADPIYGVVSDAAARMARRTRPSSGSTATTRRSSSTLLEAAPSPGTSATTAARR